MSKIQLFISYSLVDRSFVKDLVQMLRVMNHDVWYDQDVRGGEEWWRAILREILECDIFVFLMSSESIASKYCSSELEEAERLGKPILPIRIRDRTPIPDQLGHLQCLEMADGITAPNLSKLQGTLVDLFSKLPATAPAPLDSVEIPMPNVEERGRSGARTRASAKALNKVRYESRIHNKLPADAEAAANQLSKVMDIQVKQYLRQNGSNSQVMLVDVKASESCPPPQPDGPHYLKIHHDDTEVEGVKRAVELSGEDIVTPSVVDYAVHGGRLAVLYKPALGTVRPQKIASLAVLLEEDFRLAVKNVAGLGNLLHEWNKGPRLQTIDPHDALVNLLGKRRTEGEQSVQSRVLYSLGISDREMQLLFGGKLLLPNPLAFLSRPDLWKSETSQSLVVPVGRMHGDLHADNIICKRRVNSAQTERDFRPDILDFATYDPENLIFFDFAYLEFDLLNRICPPFSRENRMSLLRLMDFLSIQGDFTLTEELPGSAAVNNAIDSIRPIRKSVSEMFGERGDDFETAYWLAATAVGLNFARKRTRSVSRHLNLLGLIYAGVAQKHVLDDLIIDYWCEDVPAIAWVDNEAA